ncbi:hypothetical protein [Phenylobacterium sp.]|uniref:hypothetical protein n=1 Tax=Phenylobacterium sp. TaxID=1871053 RepID=UPI0035AED95E
MGEILLYALNEAGETAFAEQLREADRHRLRTLARERLKQYPAVEVWDGPMCVLRLRRAAEAVAADDAT